MIDQKFKEFLSWWRLRGEKETDPFAKFFFFYIYLDAVMTHESNAYRDEDKLKWLILSDNHFKQMWSEVQSSVMRSNLNGLKSESPILDMRNNKPVELTNIEDFDQVIRFIYQIRCNLFHGSKNWNSDRDRRLVEISAFILHKWLVWSNVKLT